MVLVRPYAVLFAVGILFLGGVPLTSPEASAEAETPTAGAAPTPSRDGPLVLVNGYDPRDPLDSQPAGQNLESRWATLKDQFAAWGWSGWMDATRHYVCDTGHDVDLHDHGDHADHFGTDWEQDQGGEMFLAGHGTFECASTGAIAYGHTRNSPINHLAYHWANMVWQDYGGTCVKAVGYSMGGTIIRYALQQVEEEHPDFPPICVSHVVTFGTPHAGTTAWWTGLQCNETIQACQQTPGSAFMDSLAPNPQGEGGTLWSTYGSVDDATADCGSANAMEAHREVCYGETANVCHSPGNCDDHQRYWLARGSEQPAPDGWGSPAYTWSDKAHTAGTHSTSEGWWTLRHGFLSLQYRYWGCGTPDDPFVVENGRAIVAEPPPGGACHYQMTIVPPSNWLYAEQVAQDAGRRVYVRQTLPPTTTQYDCRGASTSPTNHCGLLPEIATYRFMVRDGSGGRFPSLFKTFSSAQIDCGYGADAGDHKDIARQLDLPVSGCTAQLEPPGDREDWYGFPAVAGQGIVVDVVPDAGVVLRGCLHPPASGSPVCAGVDAGGSLSIRQTAGTSGDWTLRIYMTAGDDPAGYRVSASLNDPPTAPARPDGGTTTVVGRSEEYTASTNDPNGDELIYTFDWGDGTQSTTGPRPSGATARASHIWTSGGTFCVAVRAEDPYGFTSGWSDCQMVAVNADPSACFTYSTDKLHVEVDGSCSDDDGDDSLTYRWDWGDGTAHDEDEKASHDYATGNTYRIELTVRDEHEGVSTAVQWVTVISNRGPTASFDVSRSQLSITVDGSGSNDPDGDPLAFRWSWGDGSSSEGGPSNGHTYAAAGSYTVTLTVTDDERTDSTSRVVTVNQDPRACFRSEVEHGYSLHVDASCSDDDDGDDLTYTWEWGDGSSNTGGPDGGHDYQEGGTYTVILTVRDTRGGHATAAQDVVVSVPDGFIARDEYWGYELRRGSAPGFFGSAVPQIGDEGAEAFSPVPFVAEWYGEAVTTVHVVASEGGAPSTLSVLFETAPAALTAGGLSLSLRDSVAATEGGGEFAYALPGLTASGPGVFAGASLSYTAWGFDEHEHDQTHVDLAVEYGPDGVIRVGFSGSCHEFCGGFTFDIGSLSFSSEEQAFSEGLEFRCLGDRVRHRCAMNAAERLAYDNCGSVDCGTGTSAMAIGKHGADCLASAGACTAGMLGSTPHLIDRSSRPSLWSGG